jgi:hypothetical protein
MRTRTTTCGSNFRCWALLALDLAPKGFASLLNRSANVQNLHGPSVAYELRERRVIECQLS